MVRGGNRWITQFDIAACTTRRHAHNTAPHHTTSTHLFHFVIKFLVGVDLLDQLLEFSFGKHLCTPGSSNDKER
jgi:hypothetical protein